MLRRFKTDHVNETGISCPRCLGWDVHLRCLNGSFPFEYGKDEYGEGVIIGLQCETCDKQWRMHFSCHVHDGKIFVSVLDKEQSLRAKTMMNSKRKMSTY